MSYKSPESRATGPKSLALLLLTGLLLAGRLEAAALDDTGFATLRTREPALNGAGVAVAQVEAPFGSGNPYQVSPGFVSQSAAKFQFFDSSHPYPTGGPFSQASDHANDVAGNFYGMSAGAAPGVASIAVYEAGYFFNSLILQVTPPNLGVRIINQSFIFTGVDEVGMTTIHRFYDNYADQYGALFISGAGNSGSVSPPSTMYNGISVGAVGVTLSPLSDGRSKPDLIAPGGLSSYSTPYVSGAAAVLVQSALRGDGGADTTAASDMRTVKALLLNGAVKTEGWTHTATRPLDTTVGAGVLNVDRAQRLLAGGQHAVTTTTGVAANAAHPPPAGLTVPIASYVGWNFGAITNTNSVDTIDHYFFRLSAADSASFTLTSTLVWNRGRNLTGINNLELYLYNYDTAQIVAVSTSTVDNVEHLYLPGLTPGRYVLQVAKLATGRVTAADTYALAFSFAPVLPLKPVSCVATTVSDTAIDLQWSDTATNETGYRIERSLTAGTGYQAAGSVVPGVTSYRDAGLSSGTIYHYRVVAFNAAGDAEAATAQQRTYAEREAWRLEKFGTIQNTGNAADGADPDGDGFNNLVEYALGSNPNSNTGTDGHPTMPVVGFYVEGANKYLLIRVERERARPDVLYVVEQADVVIGPWGNAVTVVTNTDELLEVRANVTVAVAAQGFLRFSVRPMLD